MVVPPASPAPTSNAATSPTSDLIGTTLGGTYRVLETIDHGGMGHVFEAEHIRLRRRVAVKVLAHHLTQDSGALARFQREADIISRLMHPHVVQVLDFDVTPDGAPYIVMERLDGESLAQRLARDERIDLGECVRIASQIASALSTVHAASIVHRDLKPANVFLLQVAGQPSFVKLLDFGISKYRSASGLTGEFDILGTPDYMAPEQAMGRTALVDARADQFSLAAISYEMLAGATPFSAQDVSSVLSKVINDAPTPLTDHGLNLPDVARVLERALSKQPDRRFADVSEFVAALARAATKSVRMFQSPLPRRSLPASQGPRDAAIAETLVAPSSSALHGGPASADMSRDVVAAIEQARLALGFEDLDRALRYAESALTLADQHPSERSRAAVDRAQTLFNLIYERQLGSLERTIKVLELPTSQNRNELSPVEVFLVSRIDGLTLDEALDVSPLPRVSTLRVLARLVQERALELKI